MKIRPLHDWAVVKQSSGDERTAGGLYIPDSAKEKPQQGEVIAIGEGRWKSKDDDVRSTKKKGAEEKTFVKTTLKPGDKVLYERYAGSKVTINNEEFVMVREENVLGILA
ncbi:MAG: GroES family chaperonin [Nitrospirota bacterium]